MRKVLTAALAAIILGGAVAATAAPAQAQGYHHGGWAGNRGGWGGYRGGYGGYRWDGGHRHHNDVAGPAIAAGVVGLALGAALASNSNHYNHPRYGYAPGYYDYGYAPGYYGSGYGYGYGYCESSRWVWDPYIGRRVLVRSSYRC